MTPTRTAATELVTIMYDEGISHLFVNPGMHTAPLRAALSDAQVAGMPHPKPILCVHEHVAISAAHGHHLAGGGPQAVMVHVEGAALNLGGAVESAQRDRIPITLFVDHAGGGGADVADEEHDNGVHRAREQLDSEAATPATGKWAAEVRREGEMSTLVRRAFQIARAVPAGLTQVTLPRETLREPGGEPSRRLPPPRPPAPDLAALEEMAELLAAAQAPLIVAGRVGRNLASVHCLAEVAETLGAPVMDVRNHVNLPPQHPLNMALEGREFLERADAILLLDVDVFCTPQLRPAPTQAWLLQIDADCLKADVPGWAYPIEIGITAETGLALPQLHSLLTDRLSSRRRQVQERRARIEETLGAARQAWRARATSGDPEHAADAMLAELNSALPDNALVLEEATTSAHAVLRQIERAPGQFFRHSAPSPGWSIGAALGARLARPTQPVVALCDAAAFNFGLPTAAFWSAHRVGAPFLTIVLDRQASAAPPAEEKPGRNGTSGEPAPAPRPEPDVIALARACGAEGEVVEQASELAGAVERLLATTRDGVCAVLHARV